MKDCSHCAVSKYCGTMVSSVKLCNKKTKYDETKRTIVES